MASRLYYAPFARRIAGNIAPLKRESATIMLYEITLYQLKTEIIEENS
jgi:hypothetical protein